MSRRRVCADFSRQRAPSRAPQHKMVTQKGTPSTFTVRGWPPEPALCISCCNSRSQCAGMPTNQLRTARNRARRFLREPFSGSLAKHGRPLCGTPSTVRHACPIFAATAKAFDRLGGFQTFAAPFTKVGFGLEGHESHASLWSRPDHSEIPLRLPELVRAD